VRPAPIVRIDARPGQIVFSLIAKEAPSLLCVASAAACTLVVARHAAPAGAGLAISTTAFHEAVIPIDAVHGPWFSNGYAAVPDRVNVYL
jgi:hypothetical protein